VGCDVVGVAEPGIVGTDWYPPARDDAPECRTHGASSGITGNYITPLQSEIIRYNRQIQGLWHHRIIARPRVVFQSREVHP
jgi:hypothetical protein